MVSFETGRPYLFEAEFIPTTIIGYPTLRISDDNGLAFYATTSFPSSFDAAVPLVPEGWSFELEPSDWGSGPAECGTRTTPQTLVVTHGDRTVRMVQGESRRIGDYTLQLRAAVSVEYPTPQECTDIVIPELSLILYRTPS